MNRKAQFKEFILFIFRFIFLGIGILVFFLLVSLLITNNINTVALDHEMLYDRILYSGDMLAYQDPDTGRYYTTIIDSDKLDQSHLEQSLNITFEKEAAVRLQVTVLSDPVVIQDPIYLNKYWYDYWYGLQKQTGYGAATLSSKLFSVTYFDASTASFTPALLNITILTPGRSS